MEITLEQAAALLGKSKRQLRYMIQKGRLPARKVEGRWRIESDALPQDPARMQAKQRKEQQLRAAVEEALHVDPKSSPRYSVTDLRAFQFALPIYRKAVEALGQEHPACGPLRRSLALLTQGCHRFADQEKATAYREARDAASLSVCELLLEGSPVAEELRVELEQEVMPCFAGLLRRIQRKGRAR